MANLQNDDYVRSNAYELYLVLATKHKIAARKADFNHMLTLIRKEQNPSSVHGTSKFKLLMTVKDNMIEATKKTFTRKDISDFDKVQLSKLHDQIIKAISSEELLNICESGIEILDKYMPK